MAKDVKSPLSSARDLEAETDKSNKVHISYRIFDIDDVRRTLRLSIVAFKNSWQQPPLHMISRKLMARAAEARNRARR